MWSTKMKTPLYLLAAVLVFVTTTMASSDPFVGRWALVPGHSKYAAGTCPKSMVIDMQTMGAGVRYWSDTTYPNGQNAHVNYTADYNGKQALVTGSHGLLLPVSLKRIDSHTIVASYYKSFQVVATSRRVISGSGRRMTITTVSKDRSGKSVIAVGVYRKQSESQHNGAN